MLDGFSAPLDPRAVALLEHNPEVAGVYPVRAAFPATLDAERARARRATPSAAGVALPGARRARRSRSRCSTRASTASSPISAAASSRGSTSSAARRLRRAQREPAAARRRSSGTEPSSPALLVGVGRPGRRSTASRRARPCSRSGSPAGSRTANGRDVVYARSDQLIAGLDRAVDPNGDGDTHDAARIALIGVAEPFASFADSPEAQAVAGALALDMLVVAPAGNDGAARPALRLGRRARRARRGARRRRDRHRARRLPPSGSSSGRASTCSPTRTLPLLGTVAAGTARSTSQLGAPGARPGASLAGQGGARRRRRAIPSAATARTRRGRGGAAARVSALRPRPAGRIARRRATRRAGRRRSRRLRARGAAARSGSGYTVGVAIGRAQTAPEPGAGPVASLLLARPHLRRPARARSSPRRASAVATSDPGSAGRRRARLRRRRPARASRPPRSPARPRCSRRRGPGLDRARPGEPAHRLAGRAAPARRRRRRDRRRRRERRRRGDGVARPRSPSAPGPARAGTRPARSPSATSRRRRLVQLDARRRAPRPRRDASSRRRLVARAGGTGDASRVTARAASRPGARARRRRRSTRPAASAGRRCASRG